MGLNYRNVLLFTLDGITYKLAEDPDDGYRSYCEELEIADCKPKYTFQGIQVVCSMMEDSDYEKNNCIVLQDIQNGKTILEAGTANYDDWYPYCLFNYMPQNMAYNEGK